MDTIPLREHFEAILKEMDRRYEQHFFASDKALEKADAVLKEYKASANEWGDTLKHANTSMATKVEVDKVDSFVRELQNKGATKLELEKLDIAIRDLQTARANLDGKIAVYSTIISSTVGLILWALNNIFL